MMLTIILRVEHYHYVTCNGETGLRESEWSAQSHTQADGE